MHYLLFLTLPCLQEPPKYQHGCFLEGLCPPGPPSRGTDFGGPLTPSHFTDDKVEARRR